jgi:hypothetical protein
LIRDETHTRQHSPQQGRTAIKPEKSGSTVRETPERAPLHAFPGAHAYLILGAIMLPGLIFRFYLAAKPLNVLFLKFLPDDAFYYFTIARNIVQGHGSTLDGFTLTNGYHPLWMALILPFFAVLKGLHTPVAASLMLGAILYFTASLLIFAALRKIRVSPFVALATAVLFFYNHMTIHLSLNGLETSVTVACVALVFYLYVRNQFPWSNSQSVALGIALGLCVLARTDMALFCVPVAMASVIRLARSRRYMKALLLIACGSVVVAPWFWWNYAQFGSFVQVSGKALSYFEHKLFAMNHPGVTIMDQSFANELLHRAALGLLTYGFDTGVSPFVWQQHNQGFLFLPLLIAVFAMSVIASCFTRERRLCSQSGRLWPLLVFVPVYFIVHDLIRWSAREWYVAVSAILFFTMIGLLLDALFRMAGRAGYLVVIAISGILLAAFFFAFANLYHAGLYAQQKSFFWTVQNVRKSFPAGTTLGISDCGYTSYLLPEYHVVNLDGVVNNKAYKAASEGCLAQYIVNSGIEHAILRDFLLEPMFMGSNWKDFFVKQGGWLNPEYKDHELRFMVSSADADSSRYFSKSWSFDPRQSHGGTWNDGTSTGLQLPMRRNWGDCAVYVEGHVFQSGSGTTQTVQARMNWKQVMPRTEVLPADTGFQIPAPAEFMKDGQNEFEVEFGYCTRPRDIATSSTDDRCISFQANAIYIVKAKSTDK